MSYRSRTTARRRSKLRKRLKIALAFFLAIVFAFLAAGITAMGLIYDTMRALPDIVKKESSPAQTTKIYASDGTLLTELFYEQDREVVPLSNISKYMQMATVAAEDQRFYHHQGYDPRGILRAFTANIEAGRTVEGASTITQQYVKNILANGRERTFNNKLQEAALAYELEKRYSKNEILEKYLNTIYFGQSLYGVETASMKYFGKHAKDLSLSESAMLAGIIRSPNNDSPYVNPEKAKARRDAVLKKMLEQKMISDREYQEALAAPLNVQPPQKTTTVAPYFVEYVKQLLLAKYGDKMVFKGGLRVYTTIDLDLQRKAEEAAWGTLDQPGDPEVALVSLDPKTGEIKAMVGGRDFDKNKFNLATQGMRQPGSTFKTFVLAAALEQGMSPNKTYDSSPIDIPLPYGQVWQVRNYADGPGRGIMTLRSALIGSVNCVFARLIMDVGPSKVVQVAEKMGITSNLKPYPAIALGGLGEGVTPLEMAAAYGTIDNGGMYVVPTPIVKVTDANGKVIEEHKPKPAKAIEQSTAAILTDIMRDVINYGTGVAANIGRPAAGKTGTAEKYRDAWFVGFTPELSTAVWVGYRQGQIEMYNVHGIPVTGGSFPARIWGKFMSAALEGKPVARFPSPSSQGVEVVEVKVCAETGELPTKYCPRVITRYYPKGGEPTEKCSLHSKPGNVYVPSVIGMGEQEAIDALKSKAFLVDVIKVQDPNSPAGQVISQTPSPDSLAMQETTITITVSAGQ